MTSTGQPMLPSRMPDRSAVTQLGQEPQRVAAQPQRVGQEPAAGLGLVAHPVQVQVCLHRHRQLRGDAGGQPQRGQQRPVATDQPTRQAADSQRLGQGRVKHVVGGDQGSRRLRAATAMASTPPWLEPSTTTGPSRGRRPSRPRRWR